ncbi:hypothetical protein EST38_g1945 [Candolleomyces aberdarensis]|uniref:UBP-type domain-containing protein n=1 Tax=Candolleomyces aberdarensis TaxID=2316362 RepID=A0A4Q2DW56_9AGAR|nr:hypothetical protein EST38_g1945 [Candolleomyces aberdarensis]
MRGYHIRISLRKTFSESFVPASLFQHLPDHTTAPNKAPSSTSRNNTEPATERKDYRRGPITIDWMDIEEPISANTSRELAGPAEAAFIPVQRSKSGSTSLSEGIVHIFRESTSKPSLEELEIQTKSLTLNGDNAEDGVIMAVLAVPAWMTPSDFLSFVAPVADGIVHLRIIRDFAPNRSIALIKFSGPAGASEFATEYNGKPFNSMEPELCHVVHVLSVVVDVEDPISQAISHGNTAHYGSLFAYVPLHVSDCPVCRYSQTLLSSHPAPPSTRGARPIPFSDTSSPTLSCCSTCSSTTNLWICLICGNIGCGRYGQAHAHAHYQSTTHLYALELETQRVWDYAGDGYVHRLIQNKADGKLVELPSASSSMGTTAQRDGGLGPTQADALSAEKIEAIGIEYSYLLTSQLDSQRAFYEAQTNELKEQLSDLKSLVGRLTLDFEEERQRAKEAEAKRRAQEETTLNQVVKEKTKAVELARKLEKELKEEKAMSESFMKNLVTMKEREENFNKDKEAYAKKVSELQDQVRDVMFFLEAKTKIENGEGVEAEAAGGSLEISMPPPPLESSSARTNANGKKKAKRKGG